MDTILKSAKLTTVLEAVGLFIVCYIAIKILRKAIDKILDKSKHLAPSLKTFFASAVNVLLWAIAVMIVASALGINITSLVAILSVAGVALSLASSLYTSTGVTQTIMSTTPVLILYPSYLLFKTKITFLEVVGAVICVIGVALFFF